MIGVMFLYSNTEGSKFDLDYYNSKVESQHAWNAAMDAHGAEIVDDVANYADARPQVVIGDVVPNPA